MGLAAVRRMRRLMHDKMSLHSRRGWHEPFGGAHSRTDGGIGEGCTRCCWRFDCIGDLERSQRQYALAIAYFEIQAKAD